MTVGWRETRILVSGSKAMGCFLLKLWGKYQALCCSHFELDALLLMLLDRKSVV